MRFPLHPDTSFTTSTDSTYKSGLGVQTTGATSPARKRRVGQELALALTGKWPMSCVNPAVLAKSDLERWQPVSMQRGPNS